MPCAAEPRGAVREQACGVDVGLQVGDHVRQRLERPDRTVELRARLRVLDGEVERRLRGADVARAQQDAFELEVRQHDAPAVVAADRRGRPSARRRRRGAPRRSRGCAAPASGSCRSVTPGASGSTSSTLSPWCFGAVAVGAHVHEDRRVRKAGAGAPHLLTVHHEVVATVLGGRAQRGRVGAGIGLADRDGVVAAAAHDLGREPRPLLVGAPLVDRRASGSAAPSSTSRRRGWRARAARRRCTSSSGDAPEPPNSGGNGRPNRSMSASAFCRASGGVASSSHALATSGGHVRATRSRTVLAEQLLLVAETEVHVVR